MNFSLVTSNNKRDWSVGGFSYSLIINKYPESNIHEWPDKTSGTLRYYRWRRLKLNNVDKLQFGCEKWVHFIILQFGIKLLITFMIISFKIENLNAQLHFNCAGRILWYNENFFSTKAKTWNYSTFIPNFHDRMNGHNESLPSWLAVVSLLPQPSFIQF